MLNTNALILVAVIAIVTAFLRFLPFWVFSKRTPKVVLYLGKFLPYAIMAMLVVYCLKNVSVTVAPFGLPEFICVLLVAVLHKWKHNTLLSIILGTISYMALVQYLV